MALSGKQLLFRTLQLADTARTSISQIPGLSVLSAPTSLSAGGEGLGVRSPGFVALDQTRLTVTVSGLGFTGFEAEEILDAKLGVTPEFASLQHLTFIISHGNTQADIEKLIEGFTTLSQMHPAQPEKKTLILWDDIFKLGNSMQISPRAAFFAFTETLPLQKTCDRICAEIICPYPPGIPVLMPGELITKSAIEYLQQIQATGGFITGCEDFSLSNLKVIK